METYTIKLDSGVLVFVNGAENIPGWALAPTFDPLKAEPGVSLECRMGDPDLVHCVVVRQQNSNGGIFLLYNHKIPLFAAKADTNLVYAQAMGFFGQLTANVRYGVDVFENLELPND